MGYTSSSSTTTSKSKTAPLSAAGESADSAIAAMFEYNMAEYGNVDIIKTPTTKYADQSKADQYNKQIDFYNAELQKIDMDLKDNPAKTSGYKGGSSTSDSRLKRKQEIEKKLFKAQDGLAGIQQITFDSYEFKEKEDIRVTDAREKYGEDSAEFQSMQKSIQQEKVDRVASYAEVETNFLKNLKIATSDDELGKMTAKWFGPIKETINVMANSLLSQANETDVSLREELGKINQAIDQTGLEFDSALEAAAVQIENSGETMMNVLSKALSSREEKYKFELDYLNNQADKKAAQLGALYGYPPGSPQERAQAEKMKQDNLTAVSLEMASMEAEGALGIQAETEAGKKQLSLANVDFVLSQGSKKEELAKTSFDIAANTANKKENILANKYSSLLGVDNAEQQIRTSGFFGVAPTATGAMAFDQNQAGSNVALSNQLMAPMNAQWNIEQQRTFAEAKNKSTQTSSPSIFSAISSGLGMGASAAVPILTGMGVGGYASNR